MAYGSDRRLDMLALSRPKRRQIAATILWITFVLFVLALFLPSVSNDEIYVVDRVCLSPRWEQGWTYLVLGPLGVFDGQPGWLANPLMLLAISTRRAFGLVFATLSVPLTVSPAFSWIHLWTDGGPDNVVCGFGPGYYAWVACPVLVLLATLLKPPREAPSQKGNCRDVA
jgi:hypothetical protein